MSPMIGLGTTSMLASNVQYMSEMQKYQPETAYVADMSSSGESATLPCLPRRTVVLVTGNNRTKKSLVGQQAIVKRAVGLGGWHHCVLADGSEVKLQRNALSVLEMGPPETMDDPSGSSSDTEAREPKIEILTHPRIRRAPKSPYYAPDMPLFKKAEASNSSGMRGTSFSLVDLHKLETTSLKRYRRVFQLPEVDAATPKAELVNEVQEHFTTQSVNEDQVLFELVCALRRRYRKQQLLPQDYSDLTYSNTQDTSYCSSQQQLQQDEGAAADTAEQQFRQLLLLQQHYAYTGPGLFQDHHQQQQQ